MNTLVPRPGILDISPYVGGESKLASGRRAIRLAANENPFGPSPKAIEAYGALAKELHRYPDGGCLAVRRSIARLHGLDMERIVCGAGSDELIALLMRAYCGPDDEVVYSQHGFLLYPISARAVGAVPVAAPERNMRTDVDALLDQVTERTKAVFLANPNNPTGSYVAVSDLFRLRRRLREDILLVVDAAYAEYVTTNDYEAGVKLVDMFPNVVMTRTFSKIYGLASLRLGWAYCPEPVADVLHRIRGPFNVSAPAQAAAVAALEDQEYIRAARVHNSRCMAWFLQQSAEVGVATKGGAGNFALMQFDDAAKAAEFLKQQGILVRRMDAYGLPHHLRVTIGTEAEMRELLEVLRAYMS